jgi:branched-subunit amino acid transport protein AzlD
MPYLSKIVIYIFVMGAVICFCRVFPFIFFRRKTEGGRTEKFMLFVEKTAPPVAMTVLCFNALAGGIKENPADSIPLLSAAALTALLHIWRRSPLLSIFCGTALFMLLGRLM